MQYIHFSAAVLLGICFLTATGQAQGADAQTCRQAIQGKIAWDYKGNKRWASKNIEDLCGDTGHSVEPAHCFDRVMHGGVNWGGGERWQWRNAVKLCQGTRNANARVACFKQQVGQGTGWQQAIAACRDRQPATVRAPAAEITVKPEKQAAIPDKNRELLSRGAVRQALENETIENRNDAAQSRGSVAKPEPSSPQIPQRSTSVIENSQTTLADHIEAPLGAAELSNMRLWGHNETRLAAMRQGIEFSRSNNSSYREIAARGNDCDDADASIHPTQNEICNGKDDNCDSNIDEGVRHPAYRDKDGDRFGSSDPDDRVAACPNDIESDPEIVNNDLDCDDNNPELQINC